MSRLPQGSNLVFLWRMGSAILQGPKDELAVFIAYTSKKMLLILLSHSHVPFKNFPER